MRKLKGGTFMPGFIIFVLFFATGCGFIVLVHCMWSSNNLFAIIERFGRYQKN